MAYAPEGDRCQVHDVPLGVVTDLCPVCFAEYEWRPDDRGVLRPWPWWRDARGGELRDTVGE